jgi:protein phosphatase
MENHLRRLTRDDTWVQKQVDAGIITYEEAANHELRNIVTQVLGNKLDITVHQSASYELRAGDTYLLCSDGLHGVLSKEQLFKLMKNVPPQDAAEALVKAAIDAQTKDNVTAVVVNSGVKKARRGKVPPLAKQKSEQSGLPLWVKVTIATAVLLLLVFLIYTL